MEWLWRDFRMVRVVNSYESELLLPLSLSEGADGNHITMRYISDFHWGTTLNTTLWSDFLGLFCSYGVCRWL